MGQAGPAGHTRTPGGADPRTPAPSGGDAAVDAAPPTIGDVAGDAHTLPIPLPQLDEDAGPLAWLVAAAILAVLLLAPLGIAAYVWRFLRGPRP